MRKIKVIMSPFLSLLRIAFMGKVDVWKCTSTSITAGMPPCQEKPAKPRDGHLAVQSTSRVSYMQHLSEWHLWTYGVEMEDRTQEKAAEHRRKKFPTCFPVFITWRCLPFAYSIHLISLEARRTMCFRKKEKKSVPVVCSASEALSTWIKL